MVVGKVLISNYGKSAYRLSTAELLQEMGNEQRLISVEKAQKILQKQDASYRFVDVRNSIDFGNGHVREAINIPYHRLLNPEYLKKLKEESAELILYGSSLTQANSAWMILRQKNILGIKILQGTYESVNNKLLAIEEVDLPEVVEASEAISYGDVITATDFMDLYNSLDDLVVIDVNKLGAYKSSHIKDAINVIHSELYKKGDVPNIMLDPEDLASYFAQKGVSDQNTIVVYDEGSQKYSARVYYILKYLLC